MGTRSSAAALFVIALAVFALESLVLPAQHGRDMGRYVQTYVQLGYDEPVLPSVLNTRGPIAALGVGLPLELGGTAAEVWLAFLYAGSIVAWGAVASIFGARAVLATAAVLLAYPGYAILFHGLAGDTLFAAAFAGWAFVLSRAMLAPSIPTFLAAGAGMGALVLVRPSNQALIVFALLPLLLRAPWGRRLAWASAFFIASVALSQGWKAIAALLWGDAVALRPTAAALGVALLLLPLLFAGVWRRRAAMVAVPLVVALVAVRAATVDDPIQYARSSAQAPPLNVFLFRAFVTDRTVSPENGPASRQLATVVRRDLLAEEPYRSYGIDLDEFFSSGSERVFADLQSLGGSADLEAVTREAIQRHPGTFARSIAETFWDLVWTRRIFASAGDTASERGSSGGAGETVVVDGRRLPRPTGGEPIPASRVGPNVWTRGGAAREVWRSATDHPLVFDDARDARRYARFERDTNRLASRLPTREGNDGLIHRLNQASRAFPPPVVWLVVGLIALAIRRPARAFIAVVPAVAAVVVIGVTSLVALAVPEYAAPVSPAFILLAAVGLAGAHPRGVPARWRRAWRH